jgi:pilus assembly protein Flp/PilA
MITSVRTFRDNDIGATPIESGLIAAGVLLAIIAVVNGTGTRLNNFGSINSSQK